MTKKLVTGLILAMAFCSRIAFAGTVTGEIKQLDGGDIPSLTRFEVRAVAGGQVVGKGKLTTTSAPFKYEIVIDDTLLNANDVRVTLIFSALGRQTVRLSGISGKANHDITIVMPVDEEYSCHCRLRRVRRCW